MDSTIASGPAQPGQAGGLSLLGRVVAIFARPAHAWEGLETRAQWWFPLAITLLVNGAGAVILYHRAQLPTMLEALEDQVASGQMTGAQLEKIEAFYASPAGVALTTGIATLWIGLMTLVVALLVWFAIGFVLGTRFRYRLALEVTTWSGLVALPASALAMTLAWFRESFRGVHIGFGALLPEPETPSRLLTGVGVFLDWIGPLGIWQLVVGVLGAAALSGAARRPVAWVLSVIYVAAGLFTAALAGLFTRGA